jgi:hypothetical protein
MKRFGRPSAASLAVPAFESPRPQAPAELPELAKQTWDDVVSGFRSDWFQGSEAILTAYCQTVVAERQIAAMLSQCGTEDARYPELVRLYTSVVGTLISVGTKLRLTPQSSRDSRHTKHVAPGPRPWEVDLEPEAG